MTCSVRSSYHTSVKILAQKNLLPVEILKQIPRSNLIRWRNQSPDRYKVYNISGSNDLELLAAFANNTKAKKIFFTYARILIVLKNLAGANESFQTTIKNNIRSIVSLVRSTSKTVGIKRTLKCFSLSIHTFRNWSVQTATECFHSFTKKCNRIFHNQLTSIECFKIKEMLEDQRFRFWPIASIALFALRNNILPLSINTWYKYVHKLGLARPKSLARRKKTRIVLRSHAPHQIWHTDITEFETDDHTKHYIYLVVDNFSRKILSYKIADAVKAAYRKENYH
jgi:hypothetical protein